MDCYLCTRTATHALVDWYHYPIKDQEGDEIVYCGTHAFEDGREECPCCDDYWIEIGDGEELLPTYPQDTLDQEGCCSDHP